jgi:hypothetical protein
MKIYLALPFYVLPYLAFTKRLKFYIKYCMNENPCPESQMLNLKYQQMTEVSLTSTQTILGQKRSISN